MGFTIYAIFVMTSHVKINIFFFTYLPILFYYTYRNFYKAFTYIYHNHLLKALHTLRHLRINKKFSHVNFWVCLNSWRNENLFITSVLLLYRKILLVVFFLIQNFFSAVPVDIQLFIVDCYYSTHNALYIYKCTDATASKALGPCRHNWQCPCEKPSW